MHRNGEKVTEIRLQIPIYRSRVVSTRLQRLTAIQVRPKICASKDCSIHNFYAICAGSIIGHHRLTGYRKSNHEPRIWY